ncbi:MAG TPA: heme-degrading domain-containing protein [Dongiaceae bacterium]|nr:heme-degrading domain-containing protein [Dongiaceae bacterium]
MGIDQDLERIQLQEKRLQFASFDAKTAWELGIALKAAAEKRNARITIEIQLHGHPMFAYGMPGTVPDNWEWMRRKRNTVMRYHRSSYFSGLKHEKAGTTLQQTTGLDLRDYATHGGSFPLIVSGTGCVGTITVSGLPQREDHNLIVAVLQEFLRADEDLTLDAAGK